MAFLKDKDKAVLKQKFASELDKEVVLKFFTKGIGCEYCEDEERLLKELVETSEKLHLYVKNIIIDKQEADEYGIIDAPALAILQRQDGTLKDFGIRYYGIPAGYEFSSLIESIILVSTGNPNLPPNILSKIQTIDKDITIQVFVTPTCPYCPRAVITAHRFAVSNDRIKGYMIEAMEFPDWANRYMVYAVPKIVINDLVEFEGAYPEHVFAEKILEAARGG